MLSGFLTMYMAFLLRDQPFPGWEDRTTLLLGLVIGAAGLGNTIGIGLGSVLRRVTPSVTVVVALLADAAVAVVAALFYGLLPAVALGLTAGVAQAMGKLSLDATIQRSVPERHRTSAFARSETMLQLSWVVGGFLGIGLPLEIGGTGAVARPGRAGRADGRPGRRSCSRRRHRPRPAAVAGPVAGLSRASEVELVGQAAQQLGRGLARSWGRGAGRAR